MQSLSHSLDQWHASMRNTQMCAHTLCSAHVRINTHALCVCQGQSKGRRCADVLKEHVWECPLCGNTFSVFVHAHWHAYSHTQSRSYKLEEGKYWKNADEAQMITLLPSFLLFSSFTHFSFRPLFPPVCPMCLGSSVYYLATGKLPPRGCVFLRMVVW